MRWSRRTGGRDVVAEVRGSSPTLKVNRRSFLKECAFVDVRAQNSIFIDKLAELSYHAFGGHAPNWLPTIAPHGKRSQSP
jgi:hypothetical protein